MRDEFAGRTADFTYREFPIGHEISGDEIDLVSRWIAARL